MTRWNCICRFGLVCALGADLVLAAPLQTADEARPRGQDKEQPAKSQDSKSSLPGEEPPVKRAERSLPSYRITAEDWGVASVENIRAVLDSAARELWRFFPGRKLDPFVVMRGHNGPIVHFQRNLKNEIIMNLDTQDTYWSQYAYQFSHEFCHLLAGFDNDWNGNLWFEETICEAASLFVLRRLVSAWKAAPPYPNWKSYAGSFDKYADEVIRSREKVTEESLAAYYESHAEELRKSPTNRTLNGAMAVVFLDWFQREPEHWEAVAWLNSKPSPMGESFPDYLQKWQDAVPQKHKAFVAKIRKAFAVAD